MGHLRPCEAKQRVLIVDDDAQLLSALQRRLGQLHRSADFVTASSGSAALSHAERTSFDLVISDLRMPAMDGAAVLRQIRRVQPLAMRTILSGQASTEQLLSVLPLAHNYLEKPCPTDRIDAMLSTARSINQMSMPIPILRSLLALTALPSDLDGVRKSTIFAGPTSDSEGQRSILELDLGLQVAAYRFQSVAYGKLWTPDVLLPETLPQKTLAVLSTSGLLAPITEDQALLSALRTTTLKAALLRQALIRDGFTNDVGAVATVAYVGELGILSAVGADLGIVRRLLPLRPYVSEILTRLWALPQNALTASRSGHVTSLQNRIDSMFIFEEGDEASAQELLEILHEVVCSTVC